MLEMNMIADCGLVGLPNAGKSTFLASVSRALPKIANYPFTTLNPIVGFIKFIDEFQFTVADLPGIIEDSHKNKGLGLQFLRHIERTKFLIYILDISGPRNENPIETLQLLQKEMFAYNKEFKNRPSIIIANKCDLEPDADKRFEELKKLTEYPCFMISAKHGYQVNEVIKYLKESIQKINKQKIQESQQKQNLNQFQ